MSVTVAVEALPITPAVGAEVRGVELSDAPAPEVVAALRDLLARHGLLVFRDQGALTQDEHIAFARCFGDIAISAKADPSRPEIVTIVHDSQAPPSENIWHSDMSFLEAPPLGAVLRAVEVPDAGGDTLFADMRAAFKRLPENLQALLRRLRAEHDVGKWVSESTAATLHESAPVIAHPAVRRHPETGEEILFVNDAYTTGFVGLEKNESDALLDFLLRQPSVPEVQCRLRWRPGTVAFWDNRALQHYATGDYLPARRVMDRVSIAGGPVDVS
jgi:taurine dioxygenase